MQMSSPIMFSWIVFLMRDLSPRGPESTRPELIELHRTSCIAWTLMLCMDSFSYCATRVNIRAIRLQGQYWTPDSRRATQSYLHSMKDWDISSDWKKWQSRVIFSIQNIHILETGKGAHDANSKAQLESDEKKDILYCLKKCVYLYKNTFFHEFLSSILCSFHSIIAKHENTFCSTMPVYVGSIVYFLIELYYY